MNKKSIPYYLLRIVQRVALCLVIGGSIMHWVILAVVTGNVAYTAQIEGVKLKDPQLLSEAIEKTINVHNMVLLRYIIFAAAITLALFAIKRFRKYDKPLIVDSLVIIGFCLLSVVFSQIILRQFLNSLAI